MDHAQPKVELALRLVGITPIQGKTPGVFGRVNASSKAAALCLQVPGAVRTALVKKNNGSPTCSLNVCVFAHNRPLSHRTVSSVFDPRQQQRIGPQRGKLMITIDGYRATATTVRDWGMIPWLVSELQWLKERIRTARAQHDPLYPYCRALALLVNGS